MAKAKSNKSENAGSEDSVAYEVIAGFTDKNNPHKHYHVGDELPADIEKDRIAFMLESGLIKEK